MMDHHAMELIFHLTANNSSNILLFQGIQKQVLTQDLEKLMPGGYLWANDIENDSRGAIQ